MRNGGRPGRLLRFVADANEFLEVQKEFEIGDSRAPRVIKSRNGEIHGLEANQHHHGHQNRYRPDNQPLQSQACQT